MNDQKLAANGHEAEADRGDPEEALAVAETIADPGLKAGTLVDLVDALPPSELARKRSLLDRAAV